MTAVFLSDVHLSDPCSVKTKLVIRFLQETASRFEEIFILGDFFDVWPVTTPFLIRRFAPVLDVLKDLSRNGHRVRYFEGNHDFHLGRYFAEELGVSVYPDHYVAEWNGRRVFIAHGDLGNPREIGYRMLRRVLRHPVTRVALQKTPSQLIYFLGERTSRLSRAYQGEPNENEATVRAIYRSNAEKIFRRGYDVVIMGHTHIPDHHAIEVDGRTCQYINTGDWVKHFSYVEFDGREFYTRTHPVKRP